MFLYCSTSTLKPIVGIVWMFSSVSFCKRSEGEEGERKEEEAEARGVEERITEDGGLSGVIQAQDENPHFLRSKEGLKDPREEESHRCSGLINGVELF